MNDAVAKLDDLERELNKTSRLVRAGLLTPEEAYHVILTKVIKAVADVKIDVHYLDLAKNEAQMHNGEASEEWQRANKAIERIRKIATIHAVPRNPILDTIQLYDERKEIPEWKPGK